MQFGNICGVSFHEVLDEVQQYLLRSVSREAICRSPKVERSLSATIAKFRIMECYRPFSKPGRSWRFNNNHIRYDI